jgi:MFS family permease
LTGPLRAREFRLLFAARTISMLGTSMAPVALAFAVLNTLHGSVTDVGLVLLARQVPVIALLLVGGVWSDRLPRHHVMVGSNVLSGLSQAAAAALLLTGTASLWLIGALAAFNGASNAFFFPASTGIVPQTVHESLLQRANSTLRLALNGMQIAGAAVGGLVVAIAGAGWAIGFDAATFFAAALLTARMRVRPSARDAATTMLADLREGWSDFWSRTWLWVIVLQFSCVLAVETGAMDVLGPKIAKTHYGGAGWFGVILAAAVAGSLVSGAVMLRWHPQRMLRTASFGVFGLALPLLAFARPEPAIVVTLASFVSGLGLGVFGVLWDTTMQQEIPHERLSRLSAYDALGSISLTPVGLAAAGPVGALIGFRAALLGGAVVVVVATAAVFASRDVRQLSRRMFAPET